MKLASFRKDAIESWGRVDGEQILVSAPLARRFRDLKSLLERDGWEDLVASSDVTEIIALNEATLLPVIPNPSKIFCVGHNYEDHRQETGRARTEHPAIFVRFADSQIGHNSPLQCPSVSTMFDYEGELAVIVGKAGRAIPEQDAFDHVAGYSCYMDASVRDWQWHTHQFTPGKNFPGTGGFGPFLVTAGEFSDPASSSVTTRLNGDVVQSQSIAEMIFPIPRLIAYISTFTPLSPGDVIVTGTPGGVGAKRQHPIWLKAGDTVEVEIPGVGTLRHGVRA